MQITRNDDDALVFETVDLASRRTAMIAAAALAAIADAVIAISTAIHYRNELLTLQAWVSMLGAVGFLAVPLALVYAQPYGMCAAFDRRARRVLIVRPCLQRTIRQELDFDQITRVVVESYSTRYGTAWHVLLLTNRGRKISLGDPSLAPAVVLAAADGSMTREQIAHEARNNYAALVRECLGLSSLTNVECDASSASYLSMARLVSSRSK
ncbi:MAG TPA: hypothetical protein VHZ24_00765 [Pirellulales bacterium]|nr:hypothetical protein [Pirellulales bacterium]